MKQFVLATSVVVALVGLAPATQPQEPVRVKASQLARDYRDNEAYADEQYRAKAVEVTGSVSRVVAREPGVVHPEYVLEMQVRVTRNPPVGTDVAEVTLRFIFDSQDRGQLVPLRRGQQVTVAARCVGRVGERARGPQEAFDVQFSRCNIVKAD